MLFSRYKKIPYDSMLNKMMSTYPKGTLCCLYQCGDNPFSKNYDKSIEVLIEDSTEIQYFGTRVFLGNRSFDLQSEYPQGVFVYLSPDDVILKLPRGYKGAFSYYRVISKK